LRISIKTTKSNYSKVAEKVKELLSKDLSYEVIDVNENDEHYINCIHDKRIKKCY
jgi:uncharacterized protein involved in tolerance to divalent cations